jgi:hypothetical protein
MEGLRLVMLSGQGIENPIVRHNLFVIFCFAALSMLLGVFCFGKALEKAYRGNGVGMVV